MNIHERVKRLEKFILLMDTKSISLTPDEWHEKERLLLEMRKEHEEMKKRGE